MKALSDEIVRFFQKQHYVIVSTIDRIRGVPHNSCKGIVKVQKRGRIYLLDLYRWRTFANLKKNHHISITAVDEPSFKGWCLKGKAKTVRGEELAPQLIRAWENRIAKRITHRVLKNMQREEEKGHHRHPEAQLPRPEYMIMMEVEEIVDLTPHHVR